MADDFYGPEGLNEYYGKYDITFDWPETNQMKDILRTYHRFAMEFDNKVISEVCSHYDCDLSEFREWLDNKRKETQCKYINVIDAD